MRLLFALAIAGIIGVLIGEAGLRRGWSPTKTMLVASAVTLPLIVLFVIATRS
jgi:uncharacterized membrane protein YoaK (UPF0700 family)